MGDFSEDIHSYRRIPGNEISECTDHPDAAGNHVCQRRQSNSWSLSSDWTGYSQRTGSPQPEDDNVEDNIYDRESWRNTLTFDNDQSLNNMPSISLLAPPLLPRKQYSEPVQDQDISTRGKPFQAPLKSKFYGQSSGAQEAMPEDFDTQFDSLRDPDQTLTNTRPGVPVGLPHDPSGTRLQPSVLNFISPRQMSLPLSQKRPRLPSKPPQDKPDQTTRTKAQPYYQLPLQATDHQGQIQQFQSPGATCDRDRPVLPPKPRNDNTKPVLPPKPNNTDTPPPRPPKPQQESSQQVLPRESKQEAQKQPLLSPKPGVECNCQSQQPPRLARRNDHPPKPLPQSPHPALPPQSTGRQLTAIQSRSETQLSTPSSHQREQATPTASTSSEEITDSVASLATQTQTSSRNTSKQYIRRSHRHPHSILSTRNLLIASFTSLLLSLVSVSLLATIIVNPFNFSWRDRTFKEGAYKTCVRCVYLIQDLSKDLLNADFKALVNEPRDGDMYCCATTSQQMTSLLKLVLRQQEGRASKFPIQVLRQQEHRPSLKETTTEPPLASAHIRLNSSNLTLTLFGDKQHLMILPPGPLKKVEHNNTVIVHEYGPKIQTAGYYYVYSSVSYSIIGSFKNTTSKLLEHKINLVRPNNITQSGNLVKTAHTCCANSKSGRDMETSFAGGIFMLMEGDQLATSVTDVRTDVRAEEVDVHSYNGVIMLGK